MILLTLIVAVSSTFFIMYGALTEVLPSMVPESMLRESGRLKFGYEESLRAFNFVLSVIGGLATLGLIRECINSDAKETQERS